MLKHEDGTDRLFTRIQALGGAMMFFMALMGGYAKYSVDLANSRSELQSKLEAAQYQITEERRARSEEAKDNRDSIKELAGVVRQDHEILIQSVSEWKRITRWLDNSPGGTGKGN